MAFLPRTLAFCLWLVMTLASNLARADDEDSGVSVVAVMAGKSVVVQPGDDVQATVSVANKGRETLKGLRLWLGTDGLSVANVRQSDGNFESWPAEGFLLPVLESQSQTDVRIGLRALETPDSGKVGLVAYVRGKDGKVLAKDDVFLAAEKLDAFDTGCGCRSSSSAGAFLFLLTVGHFFILRDIRRKRGEVKATLHC